MTLKRGRWTTASTRFDPFGPPEISALETARWTREDVVCIDQIVTFRARSQVFPCLPGWFFPLRAVGLAAPMLWDGLRVGHFMANCAPPVGIEIVLEQPASNVNPVLITSRSPDNLTRTEFLLESVWKPALSSVALISPATRAR